PSGDPSQLKRIADQLDGAEVELFDIAAAAAWNMGGEESFKRLTKVFKSSDREKKVGLARIRAVTALFDEVPTRIDEIWSTFLLNVLAKDTRSIGFFVIQSLGQARDKRAVKPLIEIVQTEQGDIANAAINALGNIGDPSALGAIIAKSGTKNYGLGWAIR